MPSCFRNYNGCPYVLEFRFCALELLKFSLSAPLLLFLLPFSNFYLFIFSLFPVCSRLLFVFCLLMLASTSSSCSSSFFSISLSFFSFFSRSFFSPERKTHDQSYTHRHRKNHQNKEKNKIRKKKKALSGDEWNMGENELMGGIYILFRSNSYWFFRLERLFFFDMVMRRKKKP